MDDIASLHSLLRSGSIGCIGYTNDGTYCNNPIAKVNRREANNILDAIRSGADTTYIERKIPELAALSLCKRRHQDQAVEFVRAWDLEDAAGPSQARGIASRDQARRSVDVDQVFREIDSMDAMLEDHDREMREMAQRFRKIMSLYGERQSDARQGDTV